MITNSEIDDNYLSHTVFTTLVKLAEFYKSLSFSVMSFLPLGVDDALSIDSYVYSSMEGTLKSISKTLEDGRINDAHALLRKFHDSAIINTYTNLFLKDHHSLDNLVVKEIDDWVKGRESLPRFSQMIKYIEKSEKLVHITDLLQKDGTYEAIRKRCDDHLHYNFFVYVLLNDRDLHIDRLNPLTELEDDLVNIFVQHFAFIFSVNYTYLSSSDHLDALELGLTPEPDSQYFVAPFIQDIFDMIIKQKRPALAKAIKENTPMHLE